MIILSNETYKMRENKYFKQLKYLKNVIVVI